MSSSWVHYHVFPLLFSLHSSHNIPSYYILIITCGPTNYLFKSHQTQTKIAALFFNFEKILKVKQEK